MSAESIRVTAIILACSNILAVLMVIWLINIHSRLIRVSKFVFDSMLGKKACRHKECTKEFLHTMAGLGRLIEDDADFDLVKTIENVKKLSK